MDSLIQPSVVVLSCCKLEPSCVVQMILEKEGLPTTPTLIDGVEAYPWHINTKYYETDVLLIPLSEKTLLPLNIAKEVQAAILVFDSLVNNGLELLESWMPFLRAYDLDVNILLSNRCMENPSTGVSKLEAQEWCVQNGFELVELDPELDEEWEAEQDFIETTGIKRVVQALHAHIWPNLTLKERKEPTSLSGLLHGGGHYSGVEDEMEQLHLDALPQNVSLESIEERLDDLLGCGPETDFFHLFGELQTMKDRVSKLCEEERKVCAEQVVLAFWKAIGGDADEVDEPPPPS